eukprot:CAMPEP_0180148706 /NCGR_PEP_ID=MMETSP0986-20121125/20171_1 /TAXON_ID=697907 /ORGANISM="non described non described, Strain CCMP2293" /LENGTH=113 /DNA_ID=CAMNT_0022094817 /DNA_START=150 /DNA_END=491 /DNA_ORIENTATION=+
MIEKGTTPTRMRVSGDPLTSSSCCLTFERSAFLVHAKSGPCMAKKRRPATMCSAITTRKLNAAGSSFGLAAASSAAPSAAPSAESGLAGGVSGDALPFPMDKKKSITVILSIC